MKKKIIYIVLILIIVIFIGLVILLTNKKSSRDYNIKLETNINKSEFNNILSKNTSYNIKETETYKLSSKEEKGIKEAAKKMMEALNDDDPNRTNRSFIAKVESCEVRFPSVKIGDDFFESKDYKEWADNNSGILSLAYMVINNEMHYKEIKDIEITYSSKARSIVKVYIDDYSLKYGKNKYNLDAIFELEIVYEKESSMYKVNKMTVEWVVDLDAYFKDVDTKERTSNKNSNTVNNVSSYSPSSYTNLDYSKLKKLSSNVVNKVFDNNKESVAVIDSANVQGLPTGNSTGFFIRKGVLVTTYDSVYQMVNNGALRYYADINGSVKEIDGIVAGYPDLNVIMLKLKEEVGKPISIGDSTKLEKSDPVIILSSRLGLVPTIKTGIYFDRLDDDIKMVRTSLPLQDGDSGSPIFDVNGNVIGINNNVGSSNDTYESGLNNSLDIVVLKEVINKIIKTDFNDIKVTSFSSFDTKEHKTINKVSEKVWKKYEELTTVDSVIPIDLYSAYTKNKYLTVRYKNNSENIISNEMIIKAYRDSLLKEGYKEENINVFSKDKITITVSNNLGYIVVIVKGVV